MDISNLTNYNNISNLSSNNLESQMKSDYTTATDDELMSACKQFESYFLEQMFKAMLKTIPKNEELSWSSSTLLDYYKDEMIKNIAAESTEQNSLGLAQMLYEQMKRNYEL